jgi:hypothetical protein
MEKETIRQAIFNMLARNEETINEAEAAKEGLQSGYAYKYGRVKGRLESMNMELEIILQLLND